MAKPLVIGIGNPLLKDDRAGLLVIEELEKRGADVDVLDLYTVGFDLIDNCKGREKVIVVDACMLGFEPGEVVEAAMDEVFTNASLVNSHAITIGTTLKVGYEVFPEEMPSDLKLLLIEVKEVDEFTKEMSPEVEAAVEKVVQGIMSGQY
ncbi:hydrogenase maturation protease [Desulfohalovibrio reitneri]|uniref:hydrogenase maturation protease n=1 Tax=Desulfohalovibrio reitneri TaxID=1307759 RepID=UPI00068D0F76|nr:hydrogenase maturation protease [Desulfohalovibrio reitneri]